MTVYTFCLTQGHFLFAKPVVNNQIKQQGNVSSCTQATPTYFYQIYKSNNRHYEYFGCKTTYCNLWSLWGLLC